MIVVLGSVFWDQLGILTDRQSKVVIVGKGYQGVEVNHPEFFRRPVGFVMRPLTIFELLLCVVS